MADPDEPFTRQDATDLRHWFTDRKITPRAAIALMTGLIGYFLRLSDFRDPKLAIEQLSQVLHWSLSQDMTEEDDE